MLLAFVPLLTLIVVLLGKRVLPLWGKSDDYIDVQNALLRERLRGIRVIRAFNTEKREHGRIADATHIMAENIIRANVSMGLLTPLATLFLNISALLIIYCLLYTSISFGVLAACSSMVSAVTAGACVCHQRLLRRSTSPSR